MSADVDIGATDLGRAAPDRPDPPSLLFAVWPATLPPADPSLEDCLSDLHLDTVLLAVVKHHEAHELGAYFRQPLSEAGAVQFRQAVFRDMKRPSVRAAFRAHAELLQSMRTHVAASASSRHRSEMARWHLEAASTYTRTLRALHATLAREPIASDGVNDVIAYLDAVMSSPPFRVLESEARALVDDLAKVRFSVHIQGSRVTVGPFDEQPDYAAATQMIFARFTGDHAVRPAKRLPAADLNHVQAQILDRVALIEPEVFDRLIQFVSDHHDFVDPNILRLDREAAFYLSYLDYVDRLVAADLPFCEPEIGDPSSAVEIIDAYDIALAAKLLDERKAPVRNDLRLQPGERIAVVTGPNHGGKTTFARMIGQVHYLAALGCPVPARHAQIRLPDVVLTHFEREEEATSQRGKLEDELERVRAVLDASTGRSCVVFNETFSSTSLEDAFDLGREILRRFTERGTTGVYVTFVDELSRLAPEVVSLVAEVDPDDATNRTFRVCRRPADGAAYATSLAERHGLTYEQLTRRLPR